MPPPAVVPEVLAPAGDDACLDAAILAGADAVYFGVQGHNARARARNFDADTLKRTLEKLHARGRKGYLTLNTLAFDDELGAIERVVRAAAAAGVDACIVQDLAVAKLVREVAPGLPFHASTQMTCTDAGSVAFAASLGASRVILARELSLADIRAIRETATVPLEVFVHGALCVAYSGQCLTSEAIGGRSANRGACAQACRLPYELLVDGMKRDLGDKAYLLSPEDLEASALVPELARLGVASLKIEGRLKGPEYVAATTTLYRRAVDGAFDEAARVRALSTFSRGSGPGFLAGVDHQRLVDGTTCDHRGLRVGEAVGIENARGKRFVVVRASAPLANGDGILIQGGFAGDGEFGGRIWSIDERGDGMRLVWLGPDTLVPAGSHLQGRAVWRTHDPAAEKAIHRDVAANASRVTVDVVVRGALGDVLTIEGTAKRGGELLASATVTSDAALEPSDKPLTEELLRDKLGRLGETALVLGALEAHVPERAFIPPSALNRVRRELAARLDEALRGRATATTDVTADDVLGGAIPPDAAPPKPGLFVLCRNLGQAHAALDAGCDGVILDFLELTGTGAAVRELRQRPGVHLTLTPPRIRKPGEEKIDKFLRELAPDAILVRGLGALGEARAHKAEDGITRVGDFSLNVTNRLSASLVLRHGLDAFTPSFDLDAEQLTRLLAGPFAPFAEVVVHHPMPLFHMEHCVFAALLSEGKDHKTCGRPCDRHVLSLRDRAGMDHPVEADVGCRNTVFHAKAQSGAGLVPELVQQGVRRFRIELVRESASEVAKVVGYYKRLLRGEVGPERASDELRTEKGYGVVRGSLRVLRD